MFIFFWQERPSSFTYNWVTLSCIKNKSLYNWDFLEQTRSNICIWGKCYSKGSGTVLVWKSLIGDAFYFMVLEPVTSHFLFMSILNAALLMYPPPTCAETFHFHSEFLLPKILCPWFLIIYQDKKVYPNSLKTVKVQKINVSKSQISRHMGVGIILQFSQKIDFAKGILRKCRIWTPL